MLIQVIFDSLTGLAFSLVFGFNPNIRTLIYDFFVGIFKKKNKINDINNNLNDSDSLDHPNRYRSDSIKICDDNISQTQEGNFYNGY